MVLQHLPGDTRRVVPTNHDGPIWPIKLEQRGQLEELRGADLIAHGERDHVGASSD